VRRADREITERSEIIEVMENCDVCRLALNDDGYPYILPLNFGIKDDDGKITLYFHGASEGTKYRLMEKDNRASFEMDCEHHLILDEEHGNCTMEYRSVIGRGRLYILPEEEKYDALVCIMAHYRSPDFPFGKAVIPRTVVFKLEVEQMTGKRRIKKRG